MSGAGMRRQVRGRPAACHAALLCMVFATGCSDRTPPTPEPQDVRPAKILTIAATSDTVVHEFTARVEAVQSIDVSFQLNGLLQELPVREGSTIEEGALIAAVDPTDFELAVQEAEVELRVARQDLERKQTVFSENGIAESLLDDARSVYDLKRVRLRKAREQLADTAIHAPFKAYVSRRYLDNFVNVRASEPIVRLHDLDELLVVVNLPENLLATISAEQVVGASAEFSFAEGTRFPITYRENRGEAESLAQTYEVTFTMANPASLTILPGMTATVSIELRGTDTGTILLPPSAIVPAPDDRLAVWLFDPATQAVSRRLIETGPPTEAGVPVVSGLAAGDEVVTVGASQLQSGMHVRRL